MRSSINYTGDSPHVRLGVRLGGGGSKGGGGSGSSTTQVTYSPSEQAARDAIFAQGEGLYNQMLPGAGAYRGPTPVGTDPTTTMAQNLGIEAGARSSGLIGPTLDTTQFLMKDAMDVNSNPYLQSAIGAAVRPAVDTYSNVTMPNLRLGGMQSGSVGGSRQGVAEGLAAQGLQNTVADTANKMASAGYTSGLETAASTTRNLPQIMSGIGAPASMISGIGAQRENIAAEEEAYQAMVREQAVNGPWQLLQARSGLMAGMSNPVTTTNQQMPRAGVNAGQLAGGAMGLASLVGKMSDRRAKERIVYVGEIEAVPVYIFSYVGERARWIGTMADEAPAHAVHRGADGYLRVDYTRLPVPFRQLEA